MNAASFLTINDETEAVVYSNGIDICYLLSDKLYELQMSREVKMGSLDRGPSSWRR